VSRIQVDHRGGGGETGPLLVNGALLSRRDIAAEVANFPGATPHDSWLAARQALALRMVLAQRARALNIIASPQTGPDGRRETEEDATLRQLIETEVSAAPSRAAISAYLRHLMAAAEIRPAEEPPAPALPPEGDHDAWTRIVSDLNRGLA
jgi:hypothetical protein